MTDTVENTPAQETPVQETQQAAPVEAQVETPQEQAKRYDFVKDKYRTKDRDEQSALEEQAKSYLELEKRFGAFTGSPDEYKLELEPEIAEFGYEVDPQDPMFIESVQFAKEAQMSQEGFNKMMNLYAKVDMAKEKARIAEIDAQIAAMGPEGTRRIQEVELYIGKNLPEKEAQALYRTVQDADSLKAIEILISKSLGQTMQPQQAAPTGITESELREMQFAKDANGNRRIATDPSFAAEYKRKMEAFYGKGDYMQVIGG